MATFGYTGTGTTYTARAANKVHGCKFSVNEAGVITQISLFGEIYGGAGNMKGAIYSDADGVPDILLAESDPVALGGATEWHNIPISYAFTAGTYWLFFTCDSPAVYMYHTTGDINQFKAKVSSYPTFPNPFGTPSESQNWKVCIFATYTPEGEEPPPPPPPIAAIIPPMAIGIGLICSLAY